jgi:hypothetical protein
LGGGRRGAGGRGLSALEGVPKKRPEGLRKVFLKEFFGWGFGIKISA